MKKDATIRTSLGLSQKEISMLIGITRSQWSMYEIGKRDLPLPAKQLLIEMLTHAQSPNAISKPTHDKQQSDRQRQQLERLLRENEYQRLLLARKMATTQKKQESQLGLLSVVGFLKNLETNNAAAVKIYQADLSRKANQTLAVDYATILMQQELKKEVLEFEKKCIEAKLRAYDL